MATMVALKRVYNKALRIEYAVGEEFEQPDERRIRTWELLGRAETVEE